VSAIKKETKTPIHKTMEKVVKMEKKKEQPDPPTYEVKREKKNRKEIGENKTIRDLIRSRGSLTVGC